MYCFKIVSLVHLITDILIWSKQIKGITFGSNILYSFVMMFCSTSVIKYNKRLTLVNKPTIADNIFSSEIREGSQHSTESQYCLSM